MKTKTDVYDYRTHGDFQRYYDTSLKRSYWTLGYATNITIPEIYQLGKQFAKENKVDISLIRFDEILSSRRFKHFKVLYSTVENEMPNLPKKKISESTNVWGWLTD